MADESETAQSARGAIGRETYAKVSEMISSGMKSTEAFAKHAAETGRSAATVATAYYREARKDPNSGVKTRSRRSSSPAPAKAPRGSRAPSSIKQLVADAEKAVAALSEAVERQENELESLRGVRDQLEAIRRAMR